MAHQERLKTIQALRDARDAVGLSRIEKTLTDEQRSHLDRIYSKLDRLEGMLVLKDITERVDAITKEAEDLEALTHTMEVSVIGLQQVVRKVEEAAQAVNFLVTLVSKATPSGLS